MTKKLYILTETQIQRVVDVLLKEQNEKIYTDFDRDWDYKVTNNMWHATRKGQNKWVSLEKYPEAIKRLNNRYKMNAGSIPHSSTTKSNPPARPVTQPAQPAQPIPNVPFKNTTEGNNFRQWFIKNYPSEAKRLDLDPTGPFNNTHISGAYNMKTQTGKTVGQIYSGNSKVYSGMNPSYAGKIDLSKLSSSDTVRVCNIGDDTKECAQFVNNFSDKISVVGDAWVAFANSSVGKPIFSIFRNLSPKQIEQYQSIYSEILNGGKPDIKIKALEEELINQNGQPQSNSLKMGDIVGLYYSPSSYHTVAFKGSAEYGRGYYINGKAGKTLSSGIGHTFNTHVGVVGAIKNGVPLIFHNIKGDLLSDPPQNLKITWVKRPADSSLVNTAGRVKDKIRGLN